MIWLPQRRSTMIDSFVSLYNWYHDTNKYNNENNNIGLIEGMFSFSLSLILTDRYCVFGSCHHYWRENCSYEHHITYFYVKRTSNTIPRQTAKLVRDNLFLNEEVFDGDLSMDNQLTSWQDNLSKEDE